MLLDTKQTLDAEIALYRKMLEGEESRGGGLRQLVEQVVKTHSLQQQEDTGNLCYFVILELIMMNFVRNYASCLGRDCHALVVPTLG